MSVGFNSLLQGYSLLNIHCVCSGNSTNASHLHACMWVADHGHLPIAYEVSYICTYKHFVHRLYI